MRALEQLKNEHRSIERVLQALGGLCRRLEAEEAVPAEPLGQVIEFIRSYADGCHHDKEEKHLFPLLERSGLPREGGPTGVMLREHEMGRELVREMDAARAALQSGEAGAGRRFAVAGRGFIDLLTAHIHKEETVLFPMTERVLDASALGDLDAAFGRVQEKFGEATHTRYREMSRALMREWGD